MTVHFPGLVPITATKTLLNQNICKPYAYVYLNSVQVISQKGIVPC